VNDEDGVKRERLRAVLVTLIGDVQVKLAALRHTIETLQSLSDVKAHEGVAKTIVESKRLIEKYPHNRDALYHEPIFLPTPATRALDEPALAKLRAFQEAVLFTLWKVTVRLDVVDGFVRATPSLPKLVSVATTLKQLKALLAIHPDSVSPDVVAAHDDKVRAVRERVLERTQSLHHGVQRPASPEALTRTRSATIGLADVPALASPNVAARAAPTPTPPATPTRPRHGTLSLVAPPSDALAADADSNSSTAAAAAAAAVGGANDDRSLLLASIDAALADVDRRLEARCSVPGTSEAHMRTHAMLCATRAVVGGHPYAYTDLPATERAKFAASTHQAAAVGKAIMLARLNELGLHELRGHLRRSRERLGAAPTLLSLIDFAAMVRDIALCVGETEAAEAASDAPLLGAADLRRTHEARQRFHASTAGRLLETAARLNAEAADADFVRSELAHFVELEAAVVDANAREQVLEFVIRNLKAKTRALTREQFASSGAHEDDEDVDINVLELELLELTVQLDARTAASGDDGDEAVDEASHSAATKLCGELIQALASQGAHYTAELSRHLKTPAARDDVARLVTATLYPDVLLSRVEHPLLRVLAATLRREVADAGRHDAVLPLDGSSFARSLLLRYGRRHAPRAFAAHVLRDVVTEMCRDAPLDPDAEASSTVSAKLPADSMARLQQHCRNIVERFARAIETAPIGLRWLARELFTAMQQHYPQDCARVAAAEAAVARFLFGTLLSQAVLYPDLYGVLRIDEMPQTRHNFSLLSRALADVCCDAALAGSLAPLAAFAAQMKVAVARVVKLVCDVGDVGAYLEYPQRPPVSDAGALLVRAPPCHVLRPVELLRWSCLLDSTRTRMLSPSPSPSVDAAVVRLLRAVDALSPSDKRAPVPAEAAVDDAPSAQAVASAPASNVASLERMLATFADQVRDTSPLITVADVVKTHSGTLIQFVESVLAPRCAAPATQLVAALRSCGIKDEALLHRLDSAHRMRVLGRRQLFLDKCELVQALREHRTEVTALAAEKRSYVQFVQQLSTEWTGDLDVSVGHAAPLEPAAARPSGAPLDYFDTETLLAFELSVALCADRVETWTY
jgi:hypothetical protein